MISGQAELLAAMADITPVEPYEDYRAYYDEDGWVTGFAGSGFPDSDNWIAIDRTLYITANWDWLRVVNGSIVKQPPIYTYHFPLTISDKGVKIVKNHAGIVIEEGEEYTDIGYYDKRNN